MFIVIYAFVFNNVVGWTSFFFVVPTALTCLLMVGVRFDFMIKEKEIVINQGEIFTLTIPSRSKWRWYPRVSVTLIGDGVEIESEPTSIFFAQFHDFVFKSSGLQRGIHSFSEVSVVVKDLFGMLEREFKFKIMFECIVYPKKRMLEAESLYHNLLSEYLAHHHFAPNETFDLQHIRDYVEGDLPNRIDWKLSSKKQSLQYRVYDLEMPVPPKVILVAEQDDDFEALLSVFYTFVTEFNLRGTFETQIVSLELISNPDVRTMAVLKPLPSIHYEFAVNDIVICGSSRMDSTSKNPVVTYIDSNLMMVKEGHAQTLFSSTEEVSL